MGGARAGRAPPPPLDPPLVYDNPKGIHRVTGSVSLTVSRGLVPGGLQEGVSISREPCSDWLTSCTSYPYLLPEWLLKALEMQMWLETIRRWSGKRASGQGRRRS